jgi:inhibitor of KinA sporulation pathway (predicted exonuclease)
MNDKNFLALDLEMNTPEGSQEAGRIIQVGIAIGSTLQNENLTYIEKSWFVNPDEEIYPRITELTGITDQDIQKYSTPLENIQNEIISLMLQHQCYTNPVVWGGGDANLLKKELKEYVGYCKLFGYREIDLKTIDTFYKISKNQKTNSSLKSCLNLYKLDFIGTQHRAMDDARNTLRLFFAMINKQQSINNIVDEAIKIK